MRQLLEFEGKQVASEAGLSVPEGGVARSRLEAAHIARSLGSQVAVKAQVPIGGRGRAGGILLVDASDAEGAAAQLLGTKVRGFPVETVLVERRVAPSREVYCALTFDPTVRRPLLLLSATGGQDVERHADTVSKVPFDPVLGLRPWHVWQAAGEAGLARDDCRIVLTAIHPMYDVFRSTRAELVEVNPFMLAPDGTYVAVDVRIVTDHLPSEYPHLDTEERIKSRYGFDLVELDTDGEVGLITTGAGASMMLVDMLIDRGATPINFCDIRTGGLEGDPARLRFAIRQLSRYPNLRCIAVNVFAGVTDLNEVSNLLAASLHEEGTNVTVVARLEGKNAQPARERLVAAGVRCVDSLDELVAVVSAGQDGREVGPLEGA